MNVNEDLELIGEVILSPNYHYLTKLQQLKRNFIFRERSGCKNVILLVTDSPSDDFNKFYKNFETIENLDKKYLIDNSDAFYIWWIPAISSKNIPYFETLIAEKAEANLTLEEIVSNLEGQINLQKLYFENRLDEQKVQLQDQKNKLESQLEEQKNKHDEDFKKVNKQINNLFDFNLNIGAQLLSDSEIMEIFANKKGNLH